MKKYFVLTIAAVALLSVALVNTAAPNAQDTNAARIANMVNEVEGMSLAQLEQLDAIEMLPFTVPGAGVDVMRVRLEETYEIEGVGTDTVELTGWVVARHGAPEAVETASDLGWTNFVIETEFVGLHLEGHSDVFGPVVVSLDKDRPAIGHVGSSVGMPAKARAALASYQLAAETAADCAAAVNVNVSMSDLGLEAKTSKPSVWHSKVTTVPPVGQTASVTVEPVSLEQDGRSVATLVSGTIKFREIVRQNQLVTPSVHTTVAP